MCLGGVGCLPCMPVSVFSRQWGLSERAADSGRVPGAARFCVFLFLVGPPMSNNVGI